MNESRLNQISLNLDSSMAITTSVELWTRSSFFKVAAIIIGGTEMRTFMTHYRCVIKICSLEKEGGGNIITLEKFYLNVG